MNELAELRDILLRNDFTIKSYNSMIEKHFNNSGIDKDFRKSPLLMVVIYNPKRNIKGEELDRDVDESLKPDQVIVGTIIPNDEGGITYTSDNSDAKKGDANQAYEGLFKSLYFFYYMKYRSDSNIIKRLMPKELPGLNKYLWKRMLDGVI